MSDDLVVGLNQAEAGALLEWIEEVSDGFLEDAEVTFKQCDLPDEDTTYNEKVEWYIGRVAAKLRRVLPTLYYYVKMPDSIEAKKMHGPFSSAKTRDTDLFATAFEHNWIGAAKIDMPMYEGNTGPSVKYVGRGELEVVWKDAGKDFKSMFKTDDLGVTTGYEIPDGLEVGDDELRQFVLTDHPEMYDEDFHDINF